MYYKSDNLSATLYFGDCIDVFKNHTMKPKLVYADPPYFLSNNGNTINSGKIVSVNKGAWDKGDNYDLIYKFNKSWISKVKNIIDPHGVIWISGTNHNTHILMRVLAELNFKILNVIIWEKTNPPPNFYTKIFKQSYEYIIFARPHEKKTHYFNSELLKKLNNGKRFTDVWKLPSLKKWEKEFGKHPTQKPINLLVRIIISSTQEGDIILDPFAGSSTTGVASIILNREFIGIDNEKKYLELSKKRLDSLENPENVKKIRDLIPNINSLSDLKLF